jgi:hypothetical protein
VPGRRPTFIGGLALYLFAAVVLGLPLAFPGYGLLWLFLDLVLAVALGFVLAHFDRDES